MATDEQRAKKSLAAKAYREKNKDRIRAKKAADHLRNKDHANKKSMENYLANRDKMMARFRANYAANREARCEENRQRYAANRQMFLDRNKTYRDKIPLEIRLARAKAYEEAYRDRDLQNWLDIRRRGGHKRKALYLGAFVEAINGRVLFKRDKGRCGICGKQVEVGSRWHIDHVIPLSKGGRHSYANVQVAHARCNLLKSAKLPEGQLGLFQKLVTEVAS